MRYVKPQLIILDDTAEGVFLASGSGCSYGTATVVYKSEDLAGKRYCITIRADHQGEVDDRKGQKVVLNFGREVSGVTSPSARVDGTDSGMRVTLIAEESHRENFEIDVWFEAEVKPSVAASVLDAE